MDLGHIKRVEITGEHSEKGAIRKLNIYLGLELKDEKAVFVRLITYSNNRYKIEEIALPLIAM